MSKRVWMWSRRRAIARSAMLAGATVAVLAFAACGSGSNDSDKTKTPTASKGTVTKTAAPSKTGTGAAVTAPAGTAAAGTPAPGETVAAGGTVDAGTTPGADAGTPVPGVTPSAGTPIPGSTSTGPAGADPVSSDEATSAAESGPDLSGGDPNKPKETVGDPPVPPAGATIDAKTIAPANPGVSDVEVMIDLNATEPGIQSTREIKVGDVIEVGVVITNVPVYDSSSGSGGVTALNFDMLYDHTRIVAPTYINGPSTDRNPDLNLAGLGGADAQWLCLPAPEGDRDDAGGPDGDGLPETGESFLSCYSPQLGHESGSITVATLEFRAVKSGSIDLSLSQVAFYDNAITELASCPGDGLVNPVPCSKATVTIK